MTPIDLSRSLVGEIYPLVVAPNAIGRLGFDYDYPAFPLGSIGTATTLMTMPGEQQLFKWRVTPLTDDNILISCTHPKTQKNMLVGRTLINGNESYACAQEAAIPAYCEQVASPFIFKGRYVEGSPLFIQMKFGRNYVAAIGHPERWPGYSNTLPVRICWEDQQLGFADVEGECTWFVELDNTRTGANALNGFTNLKPFDALTKRFKTEINESFIQRFK